MKRARIVIDVQNDFVSGSLGTKEAQAILPGVVNAVRSETCFIYLTKDTHGTDYLDSAEGKKLPIPHCIKDTDGWELPQALLDALKHKAHRIIEKPTFGSLELVSILKEDGFVNGECEITIVGICTDICVVSNAMILKAAFPNSVIRIDASMCAGTTPEHHREALDIMSCCQIEILNKD